MWPCLKVDSTQVQSANNRRLSGERLVERPFLAAGWRQHRDRAVTVTLPLGLPPTDRPWPWLWAFICLLVTAEPQRRDSSSVILSAELLMILEPDFPFLAALL